MQTLRPVERPVKPHSHTPQLQATTTPDTCLNELERATRASYANKAAYRLLLAHSERDNAYYEQLIGGRRRILETTTDKEEIQNG